MSGSSSAAKSPQELDAGVFSDWVAAILRSLRDGTGTDVPCGECVACCSSSYFVHVGPDEDAARRAIPAKFLFPAPGLPKGSLLMGFDRSGKCPMLSSRGCRVYADRPRTCRLYDCRIFPATGILEVGEGKEAIASQASRWKFRFPGPEDLRLHAAIQKSARFLSSNPGIFPEGFLPSNPTQLAILAIRVHSVFLDRNEATTPPSSGDLDRLAREIVVAADLKR